jgi:hypothetical protein
VANADGGWLVGALLSGRAHTKMEEWGVLGGFESKRRRKEGENGGLARCTTRKGQRGRGGLSGDFAGGGGPVAVGRISGGRGRWLGGATEVRAKVGGGGGVRLAWPLWAGYWAGCHRPERTVTFLIYSNKFQINLN